AWAEWRRSGYPMLKPATDALNGGVIPRRFVYPVEEPGLNKANYESGVAALVPATDSNKSKVWWDQ
ncbi:MAG TPA: SusD/RagB family nutrient-binding outer membrane lipoprotein, partial [Bacteroidales bacterium]|nr:SusD/RagB family nutrient-binding outer membrane lipoprotein [Bacteroidales bacterium]